MIYIHPSGTVCIPTSFRFVLGVDGLRISQKSIDFDCSCRSMTFDYELTIVQTELTVEIIRGGARDDEPVGVMFSVPDIIIKYPMTLTQSLGLDDLCADGELYVLHCAENNKYLYVCAVFGGKAIYGLAVFLTKRGVFRFCEHMTEADGMTELLVTIDEARKLALHYPDTRNLIWCDGYPKADHYEAVR